MIGCAAEESRPASALIITLDTTRADALGCYGGPPGLTPHLDRIASEGVLYSNARTVAPLTLPAHASMMTGLYPIRHSARDNTSTPLPESAVTLAELAEGRGFQTAAVVAASVLDSGLGMAQGFEHYDQPPRARQISVTTEFPERPANEVAAAAKQWLAGRDRRRPFLLWVHFFDPHHPYAPPQDMLQRASGQPYLGEVAFMDRAIGELWSVLEADGALDDTFVAVVSDHGEGLGQHGESTHGTLCYDSTLLVPFLLRYPDGFGAGTRSDEIVSVTDVFPTVAEALGLEGPAGLDGQSLYRRESPPDRGVYFESLYGFMKYGWSPIWGWIDANGKYLHGTMPEFYDVARDPEEARDLYATAAGLERYRAAVAAVAALDRLPVADRIDPGLLAGLQALGYVAGGRFATDLPEPLEETGLADGRDRAGELARVYEALALGGRGQSEQAIAILREVVGENPLNSVAQDWLATHLVHVRRCDEAVVVLRTLLGHGIAFGSTHNNLGHCLLERGEDDEALGHFMRAHELDPANPIPPANIALTLERLGRDDEARTYREIAGTLQR
jgi:arylsulfatase A-like enzyme